MEKITRGVEQLNLAQEQSSWRGVIIILWSLIIAKSFCLQWLAAKYAIPVNMFIFVWIPTYVFAGLGTWMYVSYKKEIYQRSQESILMRGMWQIVFVAMAILTVMGWALRKFDPLLLPGIFSLILGMVYYMYYLLQRLQLQLICVAAWMLGGAGLLYDAGLDALGWFSLMIVLFQVVPGIILYWRGRRKNDSA